MVNALGVFGWGVGGIEAEAAMLGQAKFNAGAGSGGIQAGTENWPGARQLRILC